MSVEVSDLRVYYRSLAGDVQAVDGLSFSIADGEIMGVAGESGCGKSSLGNAIVLLTGRMRHVSGTVAIDGTTLPIADAAQMDPYRYRTVSTVPQYAMSALNPTRKIGRFVNELLKSRGIRLAGLHDELVRRLELVGLDRSVLDRYPIELSGGMKQRVVLVVSTLLNPSLLIADEITSALDVSTQKAVARMLVEFRDLGFVKSMMVITHDLAILHEIADTILVMYAGRLAEKAPADELVKAPLHPYTRLLLSSLPDVGIRYETRRLAGIKGRPPSLIAPEPGCRFRDRCPYATAACQTLILQRSSGTRLLMTRQMLRYLGECS
ncbi:MAG: ABC transporter ATP-binding protein [Actinomycetota bacterium]|nr:ABC transporter ATP-binding protein [Actinomycetota bacterium]